MRELYSSPNGDRWHLCKDASGRVFVLHQANIPSGGQTSQIELGHFLTRGYGPEQQALFQMIGTLIDSTAGEPLWAAAYTGAWVNARWKFAPSVGALIQCARFGFPSTKRNL
jgi:hypothetical protein